MKKIIVIGSVNIDLTLNVDHFPKTGETIAALSSFKCLGGKGANQVIAVSRSGLDHTFLCSICSDANGRSIKSYLESYGVNAFYLESQKPTGTAYIEVDKTGQNRIILDSGSNFDFNCEKVISFMNGRDFDILLLQLEIPLDVVTSSIREAKRQNKTVILNPAPYKKISEDLYPMIDYFTPNEVELASYTGKELVSIEDYKDACLLLISKGIKNIVCTLGSRGALFVNNNECYLVKGLKVNAIDTVAAGDCFNGYLLYGLCNSYSITDSIRIANVASGIAVTRKGSSTSIPYKEEVMEKFNEWRKENGQDEDIIRL